MGRLLRRYKAVYLAALLAAAAGPAMAQVPDLVPLNHQYTYEVRWNSIGIGRVRLWITQDAFHYTIQIESKTRGIARLFDGTRALIKANGRFVDGKPVASHFDGRAENDGVKATAIEYDEQGLIKNIDHTPPADPANRPIVPLDEANKGMDPLTGMFLLRQKLHDNMAMNVRDTVVRTYDGSRLADFTFKVISRATLEIMDKNRNAINTVMLRQPIAGYKSKELKRFKRGDPTIHVYFSADAQMIPLEAYIDLPYGAVTATLSEIN